MTNLDVNSINGIKNTISSNLNIEQKIEENVTSAISDPIGASIKKILFKSNSLINTVADKIENLNGDFIKMSDNKSKVLLEGTNIVIKTTYDNIEKAAQIQENIQNKINSITNTINILSTTIETLSAIATTATILLKVLSVQETILSLNPVSGPMFTVFKKAIKIVFLKEILTQNLKVLQSSLLQNKKLLELLKNRFNGLKVQVKIDDNNNNITSNKAQEMVVYDLLGGRDVNNTSEEYLSTNGNTYILKIEKYGEKMLIGKAYDKFSGLLFQQTAPSFVSSAEELNQELKQILHDTV
jgi:hypothetical protein